MKNPSKSQSQLKKNPDLQSSLKAISQLTNAYAEFEVPTQKQASTSIKNVIENDPKAPVKQVQQQQIKNTQIKSNNSKGQNNITNKNINANNIPQNKTSKTTPQKDVQDQKISMNLQQQQSIQQVVKDKIAQEINYSVYSKQPSCILTLNVQIFKESGRVLIGSLFQDSEISVNSKYFISLSHSSVIYNRNSQVILDYATYEKKPKPKFNSSPFEDLEFPCSDETFSWGNNTGNYTWVRPHPQSTIFEIVSPESVIQGQLGDCFLISSISVLADYPQVLKRLIQNDGDGKYTVWLCPDGRWKPIIIDDLLPMIGNKFAGALPFQNDIGVMLLEKAFAKQYGRNYRRIEVGFSLDALKDLTGAPAEYIDLKDCNQAFNLIKSSLENGFVLTVSSKQSSQDSKVVSKHCYGILSIQLIKTPGNQSKEFKMIKLRNPYGNHNNIGSNIPQFVQDKLGEPLVQSGGVFWMQLESFVKDFEVVTVCKLYQNYIHSFLKMKPHNMIFGGQTGIIMVQVVKQTHLYFGIHQKHSRYYKQHQNDQQSYNYEVCRLILGKLKQMPNDSYEIEKVIDGAFSSQQSTFLEANLEEGSYLLYAQVDGDNIINQKVINFKKVSSFCVSCYSANPITLDMIQDIQVDNTSRSIADQVLYEMMIKFVSMSIDKRGIEWNKYVQKQQDDSQLSRFHGTGFGHVFIYHQNDCANNKFIDTLTFIDLKNLKPINNQLKNNQLVLAIPPKSISLNLFRIGNLDNCGHKITFSSKSFFQTQYLWEELLRKAILESKGQNRLNMGKEINVLFYQYKYSGGVMVDCFVKLIQLAYSNQSKQIFQEQLTFNSLDNCHPHNSNEEPYQGKTIHVVVNPGEQFGINLTISNIMNQSFKYKLSYVI